jgi:hypothetical protein
MGEFVTAEAARERFRELVDQVDAAYAEMRTLSSDGVGSEFRVELGERLETLGAPPACGGERTNRALMYRVFGEIADPPDEVGYAHPCWPTNSARGYVWRPRRSNAA